MFITGFPRGGLWCGSSAGDSGPTAIEANPVVNTIPPGDFHFALQVEIPAKYRKKFVIGIHATASFSDIDEGFASPMIEALSRHWTHRWPAEKQGTVAVASEGFCGAG